MKHHMNCIRYIMATKLNSKDVLAVALFMFIGILLILYYTNTGDYSLISSVHDSNSFEQFRVKYYMGEWYDKKITISKKEIVLQMNMDADSTGFRRTKLIEYTHHFMGFGDTIRPLQQHKFNDFSNNLYMTDMKKIFLNYAPKTCNKFLVIFDDYFSNNHTSYLPILVKSRLLSNKYGIIWDFNHGRHWRNVYKTDFWDIDWKYKMNKIIYRGCIWTGWATGRHNMRLTIIQQYFNNNTYYNIAHDNHQSTHIEIRNDIRYKNNMKYQKDRVKLREQLKYKYILSIEGNDVASGLTWQLYSNSVVFMPIPTCETWAMQGQLKPFEHYVPLIFNKSGDDKWDLDEKFNWCLNNDNKCYQIAQNGKKWIEKFIDKTKHNYVKQNIITRYCNNIKFVE
eukprot:461802_1